MNHVELLKMAQRAMENAYVPYSKFQVGAALLTKNGKVYLGCNVENASFGASNCAERTAIFKAVSEGEREFSRIAIVTSSGDITFPCGICRQVMAEFMLDGEIVLGNDKGQVEVYPVKEILPHAFTSFEM